MARPWRWGVWILLATAVGPGTSSQGAAPSGGAGASVAVVYNKNVPESREIARYYAQRRDVPEDQVLGLDLPKLETISRKQFSDELEEPLYRWLVRRKLFAPNPKPREKAGDPHYRAILEARVRYLVLCYGVPLRVAHEPALLEPAAANFRVELKQNGAAVDSELSVLPLLRQDLLRAGPLNNWVLGATNAALLSPLNGILMVARLDGPTPEIARRLVDKAMQAETNGLWGRAYIDSRGLQTGEYKLGDDFMRLAAAACRRAGLDTIFDDKEATFPPELPVAQAAVYAGWYSQEVCGPFAQPGVEFMPGAIAYHLHSSSAATLHSATAHWAGPLLAQGATVTMGCVTEPYLAGTPNIGIVLDRLLDQGFTFGEAAYAGQNVLSWMITVVGDPLYRPKALSLERLHYGLELRYSRLAEWSHQRVVNLNLVKGHAPGELVRYLESVPLTPYSAVLQEKLADLALMQSARTNAVAALQRALQDEPSPQQRAGILLRLAALQTALPDLPGAYATDQRFLAELPRHPALAGVLRQLESLAGQLNRPADVEKWKLELWRRFPPPPPPPVTGATNHK